MVYMDSQPAGQTDGHVSIDSKNDSESIVPYSTSSSSSSSSQGGSKHLSSSNGLLRSKVPPVYILNDILLTSPITGTKQCHRTVKDYVANFIESSSKLRPIWDASICWGIVRSVFNGCLSSRRSILMIMGMELMLKLVKDRESPHILVISTSLLLPPQEDIGIN
ncbi:hypothetical protein FF38_05080 [Lucilia cuprina]|uniref:Uncharacterized protein n=1 Tax=Lucilia cuprina TaxID=7375 RepID=A0A0L0BU11_LUCCU|nr:hypothetical protein FF38_05080 [Lucilia cuprina]